MFHQTDHSSEGRCGKLNLPQEEIGLKVKLARLERKVGGVRIKASLFQKGVA